MENKDGLDGGYSTGQHSQSSVWREKAGAFLSSSSLKIKAAAGEASEIMSKKWQTVQPKVAEAANRAHTSVTEVAGGAGTKMKATWQNTRDKWSNEVAPRVEAGLETAARVAADTGTKLKKGILETTEKVKSSKVGLRMSEMTRRGVSRSKQLLGKVDWGKKGASSQQFGTMIFGAPLEVVVARQKANSLTPGVGPIPLIVITCSNFILQHGLTTEYIFENEGDPAETKRLMKLFDSDAEATIPEDTNPLDVAQLLLVYFKCLPEPVFTFELFDEIAAVGGSNITRLCQLLRSLPAVNLATMHAIVCLLYRISLHADINKMDAQSLAAELAPVLLWQKGSMSRSSSQATTEAVVAPEPSPEKAEGPSLMPPSSPPKEDKLEQKEAKENGEAELLKSLSAFSVDGRTPTEADVPPSPEVAEIPFDEPTMDETSIVEAVMCLIEEHEAIFSHSPTGPILLPAMHL